MQRHISPRSVLEPIDRLSLRSLAPDAVQRQIKRSPTVATRRSLQRRFHLVIDDITHPHVFESIYVHLARRRRHIASQIHRQRARRSADCGTAAHNQHSLVRPQSPLIEQRPIRRQRGERNRRGVFVRQPLGLERDGVRRRRGKLGERPVSRSRRRRPVHLVTHLQTTHAWSNLRDDARKLSPRDPTPSSVTASASTRVHVGCVPVSHGVGVNVIHTRRSHVHEHLTRPRRRPRARRRDRHRSRCRRRDRGAHLVVGARRRCGG